jgi:hypothetical protein
MKKLLLGVAAFGLMSGAALAEPQKLDDSVLGNVAAGVLFPSSNSWSLAAMQSTETNTTTNMRAVDQSLSAASVNNSYATGLWAYGITASGMSGATVTGTVTGN